MKVGIVITLIALCLPATVLITSLCLSNDIDSLVLDGKEVSSSLLRGADSIELENGRHQLIFRVEKTIRLSSREKYSHISPPLVINLDTQLVSQVNSHPSCPGSERDAMHFDDVPRIELLDGDSMPILAKLDTLSITSAVKIVDYGMEIERCNKAAKYASLSRFAVMMADDSSLLSGVPEPDCVSPQSQTLTEQRLKYWFQQADVQTRSNFL